MSDSVPKREDTLEPRPSANSGGGSIREGALIRALSLVY